MKVAVICEDCGAVGPQVELRRGGIYAQEVGFQADTFDAPKRWMVAKSDGYESVCPRCQRERGRAAQEGAL